MNRKQFLCSVAGATLSETIAASCMAGGKPRGPQSPLAVTILSTSIPVKEVVTSAQGMPPRILKVSPESPRFHVAVQNVSAQPIGIWNEDSSWGSGNLTLEVSAIAFRQLLQPIKIVRNVTVWFSNDFSVCTIPPGEMIMREITLDFPKDQPGTQASATPWPYKGFPWEEIKLGTTFRMRAVFAIAPDVCSQREKVWTGSVASPEHTYLLNQTNFL